MTYLIIGLGNPGKSYAGHRHNIGFMVADALAGQYDFPAWKKKFSGELAEGNIDGHKTILFKPQTFMNLSGDAVVQVAGFYKIPLERIFAVHDELDLPLGKLRVKRGGGNGGHNGLKSLDAHLGADYWRVRVGINHPGDKDMVSPHVLSDFAKEEKKEVKRIIAAIAGHIGLLLKSDEAEFMNKITLFEKEK